MSGEDDLFVIVALFESTPRIRASIVKDPIDTLRHWRKRYGPHIPVVIHRAGELNDEFVDQMRNAFANPAVATLPIAAKMFYRLRLDTAHLLYLTTSIRQTGKLGVALLSQWMQAVLDYDKESGPLRRFTSASIFD